MSHLSRCILAASYLVAMAGCASLPPPTEAPAPGAPFQRDVPETTLLVLHRRLSLRQLWTEADGLVAEVDRAIEASGLKRTGPLQMLYVGCKGDPEELFDYEVGFPVEAASSDPPAGLSWRKAAAFSCLAVRHVGSMVDCRSTYASLYRSLFFSRRAPSGENREVYTRWEGFASDRTETEIQVGLRPVR